LQVVHESNRFPRPFGKYLLLRQIAVGGMAEVYLARQTGLAGFEKECVIKRILPSLAADQHFVQMFLDEARIAARLSHPNIVQIFDLGALNETDFYLAMEHVQGVDLQEVCDAEEARGGRLPLPVALRIVSSVAEGLDYAHRATDGRGEPLGLVHRDVTPSNVILSVDGAAKILDFGIAKAMAREGHTEVGIIKGKIPYMSPEQVKGEALDCRSDLFSLGTLLYQLTTGRLPFDGQNAADLSLKILYEEPAAPGQLVENYPPELGDILSCAMHKKRAERFGSARELQDALDELLVSHSLRCTAHDVSAYLDGLFPDLRERTKAEPLLVSSMPAEFTVPTVPLLLEKSGPRATPLATREMPATADGSELSTVDLSSYADVRRNLGGQSSASKTVIALLVLGVAAGFYWLTSRVNHSSSALGAPQAEVPPAPPKSSEPLAPTPTEDKPSTELPAVGSTHPASVDSSARVESTARQLPAAEKAPTTPIRLKRTAEVKRSSSRSSAETSRPLPRLPGPPPVPDEAP
jgi:serine/threonine protein kinase